MELGLTIYLVCFLIGLIGTLGIFFFGGDFGADIGLDMDGFGADGTGGFSIIVFFIVLTIGGGIGMALYEVGWDILWVSIVAWAIALLAGAAIYLVIQNFLIKAQASSSVRADDFVGRVGKITTTVTPETVGVISFDAKGVRQTMSCKSKFRIEVGELAEIINVGPNIVWVKPFDPEEGEGAGKPSAASHQPRTTSGKHKSGTAEINSSELDDTNK